MGVDVLTRNNVQIKGRLQAPRTVVFVNGLGCDQTCWKDVVPLLEDEFRLVLFDHVGSVESNQPDFRARQIRYLNVSGYADDLLEVCEQVANGPATLVGHSMGGLAALLAAAKMPARVNRLVLLGTSPRYITTGDYQGGFTEAGVLATYEALRGDYAGWVSQVSKAAVGDPRQPAVAQEFARTLAQVPADMMLTVMCSVLQTDHRASLAQVKTPTLIIQARDDLFVPLEVAQYLQQHIQGSQLRLIEASGHMPHMSAPAQVVEAMGDFLRAPAQVLSATA